MDQSSFIGDFKTTYMRNEIMHFLPDFVKSSISQLQHDFLAKAPWN